MEFFADEVQHTFERYDVDILGVTEVGLPPEGRSHLRETMNKRMREAGLGCVRPAG